MVPYGFTRVALSLSAVSIALLASPTQVDAQDSVFKSGVDMVPLTVTMTDAAGNHKTGLTLSDFVVFEDGVPQTLSFFANDHVPVDVAFVIDTSTSMRDDLPLVKEAARGLVRGLLEGDRAGIVDVKDSIRAPMPLTDDHARVEAAIDALRASGSTAMYDGIYTALREFERERRQRPDVRRQVLVLLSDGLDNASHLTFDVTRDLARSLDVTIYTIGLGYSAAASTSKHSVQSNEMLEASYALRALASEAGGRVFFPETSRQLPGIYDKIGEELACQYQLGYVPTKPLGDRSFRRLSVRIAPPTSATARTRSGYVAAPSSARPTANVAPSVRD